MNKIQAVAVAIITKPDGTYLMTSRPAGKGWAGWWEFPGGKIENNETPEQALIRELQEELGITATKIQTWITRHFDYVATHDSQAKSVKLHFYFVTKWQGTLLPLEGQQLSWQKPANITVSPILPANVPVMQALALPPTYAITNMFEMGEQSFMGALENQLKQGLKLIQIREKQLENGELKHFAKNVIHLAKLFGAKVLIKANIDLARELNADGVHLPSKDLMQCIVKPSGLVVAASCHNALELSHAQSLELDFVVVSPVKSTLSHEESIILGWPAFKQMIEKCNISVYALGGLTEMDLSQALSCGARGIAMQRAVWTNVTKFDLV